MLRIGFEEAPIMGHIPPRVKAHVQEGYNPPSYKITNVDVDSYTIVSFFLGGSER